MSAIEKIIDRLASEEYPDEKVMLRLHKMVEGARGELAALREESRKLERNQCNSGHETLPLRLWDCPECGRIKREKLEAEIESLRADRDHWKANHDEMVKRNDVLRDRLDLPAEQVKPRLAILDEIDRLRAKVAAGERLAEAAEPIARQGGVPQDEDFCHVGITTKEKCGRCSRQQALIESLADWREAGKDGTK